MVMELRHLTYLAAIKSPRANYFKVRRKRGEPIWTYGNNKFDGWGRYKYRDICAGTVLKEMA